MGSDSKDGDFIEKIFIASTHDYLMVFTDNGRCYWLKVYQIPSLTRQSKGRNIVNLLELGDCKVMSIINVRDFDSGSLVFATRKGIVKKTLLSAYGNIRSNGVNAIKLDEDDDLISVLKTNGADELVLATRNGMSIRFNENDVRNMGRVSRGVKGIKLKGDDMVVGMVVLEEGCSLLTVCEKGFGKRTNTDEYRIQSRGGSGIINIKTTDRNGKVVAVIPVSEAHEIMMITRNGIIIRTGIDELREIGRNTAGVRMIKVGEDDTVVSAARIIKDDSDDVEEVQSDMPQESVIDNVETNNEIESDIAEQTQE